MTVGTDSGQLSLGGMPRRLLSCTPSRLATWQDCPRRYRFNTSTGPAPPKGAPWAHNSMGAAVHSALAGWWALPLARRTPEAAGALVRSAWIPLGFRDEEQSIAWCERAAAMVERYAATIDRSTNRSASSARSGCDRPAGLLRADRPAGPARRGAGRRRLQDRPARAHDRRHPRLDAALALYAMAAARTLRARCVRVELHHLPTGEVLAWEHDASANLHARIWPGARPRGGDHDGRGVPAAAGAAVRAGATYAAHCPEGRAAAAPKAAWAGLAEELDPLEDQV